MNPATVYFLSTFQYFKMASPDYDMALYLQNHKVPYLIDEMIIGMEKSRPQDVLNYMKKWIDDKQKTGGHISVLPTQGTPKLSEAERKELASFMPPGMGMLRRTGTVMEPSKIRDRSKGVALVTSEIKHAAEIDISGKEDSMVGAKRMNGIYPLCGRLPISEHLVVGEVSSAVTCSVAQEARASLSRRRFALFRCHFDYGTS